MAKSKNLWSKSRKQSDPYMKVVSGGWTWYVLKAYQSRSNERTNPYARWFCAVLSPYTNGFPEYGDTYIKDIPLDAAALKTLSDREAAEEGV